MVSPAVEYVGFHVEPAARAYVLRIRLPGEAPRDVVVAIPFRAFEQRLVSYQDGPALCFAKVWADLRTGSGVAPDHQEITITELDAFRVAHAPATAKRSRTVRPDPPVA
jgi:hypothetical protein